VESLSIEKIESLKEISKGSTRARIPFDHREDLIAKGYLKQVYGGLALTQRGRLRLASGQ
jgi:hypothetical protein